MMLRLKWAILILGAAAVVVWLRFTFQSRVHLDSPVATLPRENLNVGDSTPTSSPNPVENGEQPFTKEQAAALKDYMDKSLARLKEMGARDIPPAAQQLEDAIATGEQSKIFKAFHDVIFDRAAKTEELVPVLKRYLGHKDPFVRLNAAQSLYTIGDKSGYETLLDFVKSEVPIGKSDLRISSAITLAKFRERAATEEVLRLFSRVYANGENRQGFAIAFQFLGVWPTETRHLLVANKDAAAIREYGIYNRNDLIPEIREAFLKADKLDIKNASAWALASMTGEPQYVDFLIQTAEPVIQNKTKAEWNAMDENARAIKYLGTLRDPRAKETLERALGSPNSQVVGYAVVNLIFNQGGSDKARDFLVKDLNAWGKARLLPHGLLYQVASKVDDPAVRRAGEQSDRSAGFAPSWHLYAVTRKNWPIYNWIDQYVVKLNEN